jgi:hypothetical protein
VTETIKPKIRPAQSNTQDEEGGDNGNTHDPFEALGVVKLEDYTEYVKVLIGGPTGSGKTRFGCSAAEVEEMSPVLMINVDAGTMSIPKKYRQSIEVFKCVTWADIQKIVDALRKTRKEPRFKTILIDDGVEFSRAVMTGVITEQVKDGDHDPDIPNRADYLRQQERVRKIIRFLRDYPANFIMTAKTREREDEDGAAIVPGLAGVLATELPGYFDVVGILQVKREKDDQEPTRRFILVPTRKIQWVKDRTDMTGKRLFVENPTMAQIYKNFVERGD